MGPGHRVTWYIGGISQLPVVKTVSFIKFFLNLFFHIRTKVVESSAVRLVIVESSITNSTSVRRLSNVSEIGISVVSLNEIMISSF